MTLWQWCLYKITFMIIPESRFFKTKNIILNLCGMNVGDARIYSSVHISRNIFLEIGDNVFIGSNCKFSGGPSRITIGPNCDISDEVSFITGTHLEDSVDKRAGTGISNDIFVADGCWIGYRSVILGGVKVARMTLIGASSLVINSTQEFSTIAGIPAKEIHR